MQNATFLSIPTEIRDIIYSNILLTDEPINLTAKHDPCEAVKSFAALSITSRQIYCEIEEIFFRHNAFSLEANKLFPSIADRHLQLTRVVTLFRTVIGKTFSIKIQLQPENGLQTLVEVVDAQSLVAQAVSPKAPRQLEQMMVERFSREGGVAAGLFESMNAAGDGLRMVVLKEIARRMNSQWLIAF